VPTWNRNTIQISITAVNSYLDLNCIYISKVITVTTLKKIGIINSKEETTYTYN